VKLNLPPWVSAVIDLVILVFIRCSQGNMSLFSFATPLFVGGAGGESSLA